MSKWTKEIDRRTNAAVAGFRIPMLAVPAIGKKLETAIAEGKTDEELKSIVATFPGVEVA